MFKFRLQKLLDLREARERESAVALVRAEAACEAARETLARLEAAREGGRRAMLGEAGHGTVGQMRNIAFVLDQMDRQVGEAASMMHDVQQATEQVREVLNTAHVERRVLDKLRDRHQADWRGAEVREDRETMDAIALSRFMQRTTPQGGVPADSDPRGE